MTRKKRLGRGLEALLNAVGEPELDPAQQMDSAATATAPLQTGSAADQGVDAGDMLRLPVELIDDNPFQPRREFSESEISSLSESLKEHDILQPILVRAVGERFQLISGERRLRAAIRANWTSIPARIREADDRLVAELAIVENLQRKDLNPIEKALSFRRYIDEHQCTQDDLAGRLKIDRSTLANLMRLLELPRPIQESLSAGDITAGHARALLPLGEEPLQLDFCSRIQNEKWSVRDTEREVSDLIRGEDGGTSSRSKSPVRTRNHQLESLEKQLKIALGTKVRIRSGSKGRGWIQIEYTNSDEFDRLRSQISGTQRRSRAA